MDMIARTLKRRRDAEARLRGVDPSAGVVYAESSGGSSEWVVPTVRVTTVNGASGAVTIAGAGDVTVQTAGSTITISVPTVPQVYAADYADSAEWTVAHGLGTLPAVTVWEQTEAPAGYGTQAFGTSAFGGVAAEYTVSTAPTITQQGDDTLVVAWGAATTGRVVCVA